MALKLYNTISRKKEEFLPTVDNEVSFYSCGPTVYNFAHIGNFRAYMASDILKRYLLFKGYRVKHVMNITDVDDKTIRDSKKEGVSLKAFTERYTQAFFEDIEALNIMHADIYPKATDSIPDMVKLIKTLLDKGHAYKANDGIYFKISSFADYGRLSKIDLSQRKEGARICSDEYDKESVHDFALWKFWTPEDGDVYWETEIGKGRPGWHIECSAMSASNLGASFDIHSGGVDLIFPHHENEIAQSEAASGKRFVRYWFHNEYILVDGKKMSKSLGNFYTLRDVLKLGYRPMAVRYLLLSGNYRQQLNFSFEGLKAAQNSVDRLNEFMARLRAVNSGSLDKNSPEDASELTKNMLEGFETHMDDDLNISPALADVFEYVKHTNRLISESSLTRTQADEAIQAMEKIDSVLGILSSQEVEIPKEIELLSIEREKARKDKDFQKADRIRDELKEKGFVIDDTPRGPRIKRL